MRGGGEGGRRDRLREREKARERATDEGRRDGDRHGEVNDELGGARVSPACCCPHDARRLYHHPLALDQINEF